MCGALIPGPGDGSSRDRQGSVHYIQPLALLQLHLSPPRIPTATTMPSSDYTSATGGALKLKGAGIDKKKKKKRPRPDAAATNSTTTTATSAAAAEPASASRAKSPSDAATRSVSPDRAEQAIKESGGRRKTEAEKRYEEMRRKRLEDRLKKEGVKTHKEKVEELNKYLSGLSEHHDMPKIGPG